MVDSFRRGQGQRQVGAGRDLNCDLALEKVGLTFSAAKTCGRHPQFEEFPFFSDFSRFFGFLCLHIWLGFCKLSDLYQKA